MAAADLESAGFVVIRQQLADFLERFARHHKGNIQIAALDSLFAQCQPVAVHADQADLAAADFKKRARMDRLGVAFCDRKDGLPDHAL